MNGSVSRSRTTAAAIREANRSSPYSRRTRVSSALRVGVEDVGRGRPAGRVHPHVERRVLAVGEAAVGDVELHGGDAEVEEDAVGVGEAEVGEHVGDRVVGRVHGGEPVAVRREALPRQAERLGVAVDPDDPGQLEPAEHGLGVAAEAEGRVDQHGALVAERRRQEGDDPVEEHRDVGGAGHRPT